MAGYNSQVGQGTYNIQMETTSKECYEEVQKVTRRYITHKAITNADKVRSMTDEDLASVVMCPNNIDDCMECPKEKSCYQCSLDWLKEEVDG